MLHILFTKLYFKNIFLLACLNDFELIFVLTSVDILMQIGSIFVGVNVLTDKRILALIFTDGQIMKTI